MVGVYILSISIFLFAFVVLGLILPNFKRDKMLSNIATMMNMSELERERSNQGYLTRYLTQKTKKSSGFNYLLGEANRRMYMGLSKKDSYEVYIFNNLITSLAIGSVPLMLYALLPQKIFLAAAPLIAGFYFYTALLSIKKQYKLRQNLLIRDLPNMISKMIIALEVGRPLTNIFREISESKQTSYLLSQMLKRLITDSREISMQDALDKFANEVDLPVVHDFASVVNVVIVRGFHEAEKELNVIKDDLRDIRYISLREQTNKNPGKIIKGYILLGIPAVILVGKMVIHIFSSFAAAN